MELEEQVTLTCEASGDPIPSITWRTSTRNISSEEKVQRRPRVSGVWDADLKHLKSTPCPVPFGTWENGMGVIHSHCWSCSFPPPACLVMVYSTPSCNGMGTVPCIDNQGHMGSRHGQVRCSWEEGNSEFLTQACRAVRNQDKQESGAPGDIFISSGTPRKVSLRNNRDQDESINSLPRVSYTHAVCTLCTKAWLPLCLPVFLVTFGLHFVLKAKIISSF